MKKLFPLLSAILVFAACDQPPHPAEKLGTPVPGQSAKNFPGTPEPAMGASGQMPAQPANQYPKTEPNY